MAISTARRMGAVVEAYDTRVEVREQSGIAGAKFVGLTCLKKRRQSRRLRHAEIEEFYRMQREQMTAKSLRLTSLSPPPPFQVRNHHV